MNTTAPLYFDVISRRVDDQNGVDCIQTIVGLAGVPIIHGVVQVEQPDDEAAVSTQAIQERQRISADFAERLKSALIAAEQIALVLPEPDATGAHDEPADQAA